MMAPSAANHEILLETRGIIAIITLNLPKKLNALTQDLYYRLACVMREVAAREDIYITVLTGKGRYFSAGADVQAPRPPGASNDTSADDITNDTRRAFVRGFVANNLDISATFYNHPKILVTALNGPVIGLSAALISFSDFVYAAPHTFLLTPFTSLGLVAEGAASMGFVQRLGISKANEALIMSKRIPCEDLAQVGFVNKVFQDVGTGNGEDGRFLGLVLKEVEDRLTGGHLNPGSLTRMKALIRKPEREKLDAQNFAEVMGGLERFVDGVPQEEFRRIASGEKRHKL